MSFPVLNRSWPAKILPWLPAALGLAGGVLIMAPPIWTFRFLAFVPLALRLLLGTGVALMGLAAPWLANHVRSLGPRWDVTRLPTWLAVGGSGLIFWLGAERTHYGDGLLKLQLLGAADFRAEPPYIWKAPLEGLVGYLSTQAVLALSLPAQVGITLQSVAAGVLYFLVVLALARRLTQNPGERTVIVVGLLALGSSQLWFGHVENYSLATAGMALTLAAALAYLDGALPLAVVGLLGGTAVSFHPQALFAMMALPLLTDPQGRWRQMGILAVSGALVPLATVGILLILGVPLPDPATGYVGDRQIFWTWSQFVEPGRLAEILDNLWLLIPSLPVLALILAVSGWWKRLRDDRKVAYVSGVGAGLLLYHFAFQNDLPRWQDWDLYAMVGPGVALWGLAAWVRMPSNAAKVRLTQILLPGLAFAVAVSASWVGVNHAYRLLDPAPANRGVSGRYVAVDLLHHLDAAAVVPATPICADPTQDPTGCRRVAPLTLTMPTTGEVREAIFAHAPAQVGFDLTLPQERTFLWISPVLDPAAWGWGGDGVTFQVEVEEGDRRETLWQDQIIPSDMPARGWAEVAVDLSAYRGAQVTLWLVTQVGPSGNGDADRAAWGTPWIMLGTPDPRQR